MSLLRDRDYRAALDLVGEAHDSQDRDEFRAVLLPGFRRLVDCEWASYNELSGTTPVAGTSEPAIPTWAAAAWERHSGENPLLQRFLRTRDGRPVRFSDVSHLAALRRLPIFEEFYLPLGIDRQIAFVLPSTPELTIAIALSRGGRDFGERDRELLELARPHLIQAYRAAELRERLIGTLSGLRSGLDADGTAVVVLDARGRVRFATVAARDLTEAALAAPLVEGSNPPPPFTAWLERGEASGSILIPGAGDALLARRVKSGDGTVVLLDRAGRVLNAAALRQLGLSPREAEVLNGLARGGSTLSVAAELGIGQRTLAKHLQRIHGKLGVPGRAQAVAIAWAAAGAPRAATSETRT